jgi:CheY-like chemotaxis protein
LTYTLLLADDSVTIQRVIELTFAEEDVRVITVGDGQSAIDRLDSNPPDIVLADVDMPKRDGYEVAAYVKSRPKLAHIPVVLLTGAFEPIDQARAEAAGSSDVLAKPFEPQMVINRVKQLLGRKREEEVAMPAPQSAAPPVPDLAMKAPSAPRPPARSSMAMNDEHATTLDQPARQEPGKAAQEPVSLDDYFDQLDAAFSNLQSPATAAQHDTMRAEEDWMDSQQMEPPPQVFEPLITPPVAAAPAPEPPPPAPAPAAFVPPVVTPAPTVIVAPPPAPAPIPVVVAAPPPPPPPPPAPVAAPPAQIQPASPRVAVNPFAELSAVKAEVAARPPAPVITDEVIEEVVTRVLQRLSDRVVRETVTEIVSKTAERLVQEEILRIKTEGQ